MLSARRIAKLCLFGLICFLLGAVTARVVYETPPWPPVEVPSLGIGAVDKTSVPAPPESHEYHSACADSTTLSKPALGAMNKLLRTGGWRAADAGDPVPLCSSQEDGSKMLLIVDDCDKGCGKAAILSYDAQAGTLTPVATLKSGGRSGAAVFAAIIAWGPDAITYREEVTPLESRCRDSAVAGKTAYQDVEVSLADGSSRVRKACSYVSCKLPLRCLQGS